MTPEEESDALLDGLSRGEPPDDADPAARLLAVLLGDVSAGLSVGVPGDVPGDGAPADGPEAGSMPTDQWRSSVSMTPST
ncbi:hypothetical protein FHU36_007030 [Nonomuraea muscovyensis]|uniref:Uncharacterized protein n=1 Tax=Nonomuraea muscovyensis TaxID=1124761 RepID=A0A7X0C8E2_9ACTN|nr:hypothetical protein [Nonomuraea muscovyensis]